MALPFFTACLTPAFSLSLRGKFKLGCEFASLESRVVCCVTAKRWNTLKWSELEYMLAVSYCPFLCINLLFLFLCLSICLPHREIPFCEVTKREGLRMLHYWGTDFLWQLRCAEPFTVKKTWPFLTFHFVFEMNKVPWWTFNNNFGFNNKTSHVFFE